MSYLSPGMVMQRHMDINAERQPVTLRRRQCACGKQTTVKQLVQYKVCASCAKGK